MSEIKVLIVDDSLLAREMIKEGLLKDPGIKITGLAKDPYEARDLIVEHKPDVITLDVDLPRMNGVDFLKKIMRQYPIPVVMVSAYTENGANVTIEALDSGAVDFVTKPGASKSNDYENMMRELITKIKIAAFANLLQPGVEDEKVKVIKKEKKFECSENCIIAIGASTGGTEAGRKIISSFKADTPPVLIAQHMPAGFTKAYAERLDSVSEIRVKEAEEGDRLRKGHAYIAPGGKHLEIKKINNSFYSAVFISKPVNRHIPSVDVLFNSVADICRENAIGIILTGMGHDGAEGLKNMNRNGAYTIAQDENSSLIYGMPKVAVDIGAADKVLSLNQISSEVLRLVDYKGIENEC